MKAFIEWIGTFNEADSVSHKGMYLQVWTQLLANRIRSQYQHMHNERRL
jgi:hypothetical protein